MNNLDSGKIAKSAWLLIVVASLGYFVDIYDLVLFNVVKKESLDYINLTRNLGLSADEVKNTGLYLFDLQMIGMLVGGLLWGILGDKRGRKSVMFGSILLYSLANIANAFTFDLTFYAIVRVIAGIGLAGELGSAITLVSESMPTKKRGYGTMIIVTFGALGAVFAGFMSSNGAGIAARLANITSYPLQNWQLMYINGGIMGLILLVMRAGTIESGMFRSMKESNVPKGNFFSLFTNGKRLLKYICCILVGVPIWYMIAGLVNMSQEVYAFEFGLVDDLGKPLIKNGKAVMWTYVGLSAGDLLSGLLSQILKSRKKVVYLYLMMSTVLVVYFLFFAKGISVSGYYTLCFLLGCATGYWAIFVTMASEQFGTNIRSTVTNTVPNFVRGSVTPVTMAIVALAGTKVNPGLGNIWGPAIVGAVVLTLAFVATALLKDSFSKDLNYFEEA